MERFSDFGDYRDYLNPHDRATWPRRFAEAVAAGGDPVKLMHRAFAKPLEFADPVVTKFVPGEKHFRAVTKLAPAKVDAELRQFEGWATKPEIDRTDEIVAVQGVRYHNPTVLLVGHDHKQPVGKVWFTRKSEGVWFKAQLPEISEPGPLRDRVETAWQSVKAGLLTSVSIGFRALEVERRADGVLVYTKTELFELSLVSVPALQSAQIDPTTIKGMSDPEGEDDAAYVAFTGRTKQQLKDEWFGAARRILGKNASQPASLVTLYVMRRALDLEDDLLAAAILKLDDRLKALEAKHGTDP